MRKAFTISAVGLAASIALAAPAAAFAADAPSTNPSSPSASASPSDKASVQLHLSSPAHATGFRAGEQVKISATTSDKAQSVKVVSDAFGSVSLHSTGGTTWTGTATVKKDVKIGTYPVTATANFGDTGAQTTASISTWSDSKPTPQPGKATFSMSTDGGRPGDHVGLDIKGTGELKPGAVYVKSDAFDGGKVVLKPVRGVNGAWHGTATVSKNTKAGYYGVTGYADGQKVDTLKFGVAAGSAGTNTSHGTHNNAVKPVAPGQYKTPKGSVQTGMAPVADSHEAGNIAGIALASGLGVTALAGADVLRRRRHDG
ncbi:hypothetical protein [Streptomyces sp. NPDC059009]|uniref:hypothetical protein n=1 Tax=Streptomyces sp. NPDC059009 TaxID=3346694 RepID=UPI0036C8504E